MENRQIKYSELRSMVIEEFPEYDKDAIFRYTITPYTFEKMADLYKIPIIRKNINLGLDDEEIYSILFKDLDISSSNIVVTDLLLHEELPEVKNENLFQYIVHDYPEKYDRAFFQPLDCLFFDFKKKVIIAIHHEGYFFYFNWANK